MESQIHEIKEYDVSYHTRVMIDLDIRAALWYKLSFQENSIHTINKIPAGELPHPDFTIMAYDIETTKLPLKFPDKTQDQIMLISYLINGDGFLITNREIISEDIQDFEYNENEELATNITVYNEANERGMLLKFIQHI